MPYTVIGGIGVMTLADNCSMQNPANVMTLDNQVMFCGNATLTNYTAGSTFATLSETSLAPDEAVIVPVCVTSEGQTRIACLSVGVDGALSLPFDYMEAIVHLNGVMFSSNSKYYTPEIGNVYNNGTSPLSDT